MFTCYKDGRLHPVSKNKVKEILGYIQCQDCNKPFKKLKAHNVHIHHKDEDHTNHELDNLTLLCVDCHMKYHKTGNRNNHLLSMEIESEICEAYATGIFKQKEMAASLGVGIHIIETLLRRSRL